MSDEEINEIKDEEKEKLEEEMQTEPEAEAADSRRSSGWIGGVVLILVGVFFLLNNVFGYNFAGNWWAIFIFIPAIYSLSRAWTSYRRHGELNEKARGNLIGGLLIGAVAVIFLLGLSFGSWWPIFIIIVGIGALLAAR